MNTDERRPLIRKKYNLAAVLRMVFMKMAGVKTRTDLHIPDLAGTAGFKSMLPEQVKNGSSKTALKPDYAGIVSAMEENDLRGFGGGGYPMADKLRTAMETGSIGPVLIINGVECDPGLYHDRWILENKRKQLEEVSEILKQGLGLTKIYLAKKSGTDCDRISGVITIDVPDSYPAGEEKQLASYLLGIDCDENTYPAEKGIWVQNVQSLLNLHSVLAGRPVKRYLTMTDLDQKQATVIECSPEASVYELADGVFGHHDSLHLGGGIMQAAPSGGDRIIDSRISLITAGKAAEYSDGNCRRCGQCTIYCPAGLQVEDLISRKDKGEEIPFEQRDKCLRCGACSYVCPAGRDLCSMIASE